MKRFLMGMVLAMIAVTPSLAEDIVQDTEYYILEAQNGEQWAADDKVVDQKLAEFREKNGGKSPNILYILVDDIGFGDLGIPELNAIRGYQTPNINKFSDESMRFARMYTEPSCTPTCVAFMTGRQPHRNGMGDTAVDISGFGLADKEVPWRKSCRRPATTPCTSANGTLGTSWRPGRTTRGSILPPFPSISRVS